MCVCVCVCVFISGMKHKINMLTTYERFSDTDNTEDYLLEAPVLYTYIPTGGPSPVNLKKIIIIQ